MASSQDGRERKQMYGFRAESTLAKHIDRFAEENDLSQSDAIRELVREGLEAKELRDEIEANTQTIEDLKQRLDDVEDQQDSGLLSQLF